MKSQISSQTLAQINVHTNKAVTKVRPHECNTFIYFIVWNLNRSNQYYLPEYP